MWSSEGGPTVRVKIQLFNFSEICVKQTRVNQGLGVDETNLSLQGEQTPEFQRVSDSQGQAVKVQLDLRSKTCAFFQFS
jgi:hypothetical protein